MVYLIRCASTGLVKIGHSSNPQERLRVMQTMSASNLSLLGCINSANSSMLEYKTHEEYRHKNDHSEWFRLDAVDVERILSLTDLIMDVIPKAPKKVKKKPVPWLVERYVLEIK